MFFQNRLAQTYLRLGVFILLALSGCSGQSQSATTRAVSASNIAVANVANEETTTSPAPESSLSQTGEWAMEGYSPQRTRATTDRAFPPLTINQEYAIGGETQFGSPVGIAGGLVFVEGDRKLHALTIAGGKEQWAFDLPGFFLSPAIAGNSVFVRAESGNEGYVFALTADRGLKLWQFKFPRVGSSEGNLGGHVTSPMVVEGLVFIGAGKSFLALDAQTGRTIWTFKTAEPITSSATIADDTVFFVDFNNLYALDLKTGAERWRFAQGSLSVVFAPVVIGDHVVTTHGDTAHMLNRHTGQGVWSKTVADERLVPAGAAGERVYLKSVNGLYALDRASGEDIWLFQVTDFISLPAITADFLYVITRAGGSGQLRAINLSDGAEVWQTENERLVNAAPVVSGGQVYARTIDGSLLVYAAG